ncbi:hypothetical protein B0H11DRAFT_2305835 [Mycena galericulata]|nr:hypothetical protein B0H11DRAFT_2305835 [Mycena galericulata]
MSASPIEEQLKVLRESLQVEVPYTGGVYTVKPEALVVYYDVEGENSPRRIDLGQATEAELAALTTACQKATFGMGAVDVLDESYRKAGKLDLSKFAARFDVAGLLETITPDILAGQSNTDGEDKFLRAEMYKLNVYGSSNPLSSPCPGSFFKSHKDTPRAEDMIGSLVVVFPTAHAGGELTLEHAGATWTFDSAAELSAAGTGSPAFAYVAFYSDVTHAVEPVRSGYRVTLTYNLFLADRSANPHLTVTQQRHVPAPEAAFEEALRALLADASFLPAGGLLAYGLAHQYPIPGPAKPPSWEKGSWVKGSWVQGRPQLPPTRLGRLLHLLKGADARIRTVAQRLGLPTAVQVLYDTSENYEYEEAVRKGRDVLADDVLNMEHVNESNGMSLQEEIVKMGVVVQRPPKRAKELREERNKKKYYRPEDCPPEEEEEQVGEITPTPADADAIPVHWVTRITALNRVGSTYVRYGNEADIKNVYGNAALFVRVPAFGEGTMAQGFGG